MGSRSKRAELVIGGVYIPFSGGKSLYDIVDETDTAQDLSDQAYQATPTLYINMHPPVKAFKITGYRIGYVDSANANDLANLYLFEDASADNDENQRQAIPIDISSIAETPVTGLLTWVEIDTPIPVKLASAGKLYFMTNWTTAVIDCGAAEHFVFIVYGEAMECNM